MRPSIDHLHPFIGHYDTIMKPSMGYLEPCIDHYDTIMKPFTEHV